MTRSVLFYVYNAQNIVLKRLYALSAAVIAEHAMAINVHVRIGNAIISIAFCVLRRRNIRMRFCLKLRFVSANARRIPKKYNN